MKKLIRLTLAATLFCVCLMQGGCSTLSKSGVFRNENALANSYEAFSVLASGRKAVNESARDIPVAYDVDVVVVGGTSGGVAAA